MSGALPHGIVTFVMTDIEGSTNAWEREPDAMKHALLRHDEIVLEAVVRHSGSLIRTKGEGDSTFSVFASAGDAVHAALDIQRDLGAERWETAEPIRVRIAMHTGTADERDSDYFGPAVNRCARLRSIAHGGQTIMSAATSEAVENSLPDGCTLVALGDHRLKDLAVAERVFQLCHPDVPQEFPPLRSVEQRRHNLPGELTTFVGRDADVAELTNLLARNRCVTATGAAGVGKTRLVLRVAQRLVAEFEDGVWLVELETLPQPEFVSRALAAAVGLREETHRDVAETIAETLDSKRCLLVLDNCEHLIDACAELGTRLLRSCPNVHIVATSREPLQISGEVVWRVPPLPTPAESGTFRRGDAFEWDATRLFIERALLARPDFVIDDASAVTVAEICRRLDGIPLAIELAAARVNALSLDRIAERLQEQFSRGSTRAGGSRHQTLQRAIEWSYQLLTDGERKLFARLGVFAGSFSLESAEAIAGDKDVSDLLPRLVDKSLVQYEPLPARYRMLETLRFFAREKLDAFGERDAIARRHAKWFRDFAEHIGAEIGGGAQREAAETLEMGHDDLRAAIAFSLAAGDAQSALATATAMTDFWFAHGYLSEGRAWLRRALSCEADAEPLVQARARIAAATLAWRQGDFAGAQELFEASLAALTDPSLLEPRWRALTGLAICTYERGDGPRAITTFQQALDVAREMEDPRRIASGLNNLGEAMVLEGDPQGARALFDEAISKMEPMGSADRLAVLLANRANVTLADSDIAGAAQMFHRALSIAQEVRSPTAMIPAVLGLAEVAAARRQLGSTARLLGATDALLRATGAQLDALAQRSFDKSAALAAETLGSETLNTLRQHVASLSPADAISYALEDPI